MRLALENTNPLGRGRSRLLQNLDVVYFGWKTKIKTQSQTSFELRLLHLENNIRKDHRRRTQRPTLHCDKTQRQT